jgi:hypothetical protein
VPDWPLTGGQTGAAYLGRELPHPEATIAKKAETNIFIWKPIIPGKEGYEIIHFTKSYIIL